VTEACSGSSLLIQRGAGVLLHINSLPGSEQTGNLGESAYRFVDFLANSGFHYWQTLPITPTHGDGSPYSSVSSFAGNPEFICFQQLSSEKLADDKLCAISPDDPQRWLALAEFFKSNANTELQNQYRQFIQEHSYWLDDYARFQVLKLHFGQQAWTCWPEQYRDNPHNAEKLACKPALEAHYIQQFLFFRQWLQLKDYANDHGIQLIGDLPIFVAHDSADCWVHRQLFKLRADGSAEFVSGVPPDYFSAHGQRWGNPSFNWPQHQSENFNWWRQRITHHLALFDLLRIDHFRGFEACWEIDSHEDNAINGQWVKAPGEQLFQHLIKKNLAEQSSPLPIIAEDLGVITPAVEALRDRFGFPGMKILQFAFDGDNRNPYLPHNHCNNSVVYTGTHDNDTTLGWARELSPEQRQQIHDYFGRGINDDAIVDILLRAALASVAQLVIVPLQDILRLGSDRRMNIPGTQQGNWRFRFHWSEFKSEDCTRLRQLNRLYGRS